MLPKTTVKYVHIYIFYFRKQSVVEAQKKYLAQKQKPLKLSSFFFFFSLNSFFYIYNCILLTRWRREELFFFKSKIQFLSYATFEARVHTLYYFNTVILIHCKDIRQDENFPTE